MVDSNPHPTLYNTWEIKKGTTQSIKIQCPDLNKCKRILEKKEKIQCPTVALQV
jgi:hypothetical protein